MMHQDLLKCLNLICICKDEVIITRLKWLKYHPFDDMSSYSLNSRVSFLASFLEEEENNVEHIMKTVSSWDMRKSKLYRQGCSFQWAGCFSQF